MRSIAHASRGRRSGGHFLRRLQGSLLFSPPILLFVLALFLWQFGQIREIAIRVVEPGNERCGTQLVLGFLAFAALTAMLYFSYLSACVVLRQTGIGYGSSLVYGSEVELRHDRQIVWLRDIIALACASLPIGAIGLAFLSTSAVVGRDRALVGESVSHDGLSLFQLCAADESQVPAQLAHVAIAWLTLAGLLLVALFLLSRLELLRGGRIGLRRPRTQRHWLLTVLAVVVLLLPIPLINLHPEFNEALFNFIGPLATLGLVLMSTAWLLFVIGEKSRRRGVPYFLIIVILVFVVGLLLWVRGPTLDDLPERATLTESEKAAAAAELEADFVSWLNKRSDKAANTRPYPVYIIASPGGGIYAASFVASVVSRLEARCPGFSQHVFAISAVSGGAIGSSMVDAISHETPQVDKIVCSAPAEDDPQVKLVKAMLSDDHLSPTMASTIPDVVAKLLLIATYEVQRFARWTVSWGFPETSKHMQPVRFDLTGRAEALETSLTESVRRACKQVSGSDKIGLCKNPKDGGPLGKHFDDVWKDSGAAPALVLNTTWAETGERIAFAPFPLGGVGDDTLTAMSELRSRKPYKSEQDEKPETLVKAAVVSARFPAVLPAMIEAPSKQRYWWNFVDGGYADASGATTALEIYQAIEKNQKAIEEKAEVKFDLKLILLTESTTDPKTPSGPGLSHAISPITTLLTIREQIGRRAVARVSNDLLPVLPDKADTSGLAARDCASNERSRMYRIILNNTAIALPLGWMLSRHTADTIDRLVNFPDKINIDASNLNEAIKQSLHDNVKVNANTFRAIEASLTGKCSEAAASLP